MKAQLEKYLRSFPTPIESHRRWIRMIEIEVAHPSRQDYLSNVDPHNYTNLLNAIHVTTCGSCNNIDQKVRNFIWGSSQEKKKVHLARWEIVTNIKENGGLGISEYKYSFHGQTRVEAHSCNERPLGTCAIRKIRGRQGGDSETNEETIFFKFLASHNDWCRRNQKRNKI